VTKLRGAVRIVPALREVPVRGFLASSSSPRLCGGFLRVSAAHACRPAPSLHIACRATRTKADCRQRLLRSSRVAKEWNDC
jgi:hypothetical protein